MRLRTRGWWMRAWHWPASRAAANAIAAKEPLRRARVVETASPRPKSSRLILALYALGSVAGCATANAQLTGHIALLSDYRYRGESLTDGRPALQGGLDYQHSSGLFVGALASNVRVDVEVSGLGGQLYGGYAHALNERSSWELGVITYVFPHPRTEPDYVYTEGFVGGAYENINARAYYSDNYFGAGGRAAYVEINASRPVSARIALIGHLGYLGHHEARPPSYPAQERSMFDARAGISIEWSGFAIELSVVGTTAQKNSCHAGTGHCDTTAVVSISRSF